MQIKDITTRKLLMMLNQVRRARSCEANYGDSFYDEDFPFTQSELKAELANREHIPNKQEAKKIRQQRAKQKR